MSVVGDGDGGGGGVGVTFGAKRIVWLPSKDLIALATAFPAESFVEFEANGSGQYVHTYDSASYEGSLVTWFVPNNYDPAGAVRYRVIWRPSSTNTGVVRWRLAHSHTTPDAGELIGGTGPNDYAVSDDAGLGVANAVQVSPWATKNMTSGSTVQPDDLVHFYMQRAGGDANDTFTGDAQLLAVEFEYQTNAATND